MAKKKTTKKAVRKKKTTKKKVTCKTGDNRSKTDGKFKPGTSGNPAGRPRKPEIALLREAISKVQANKEKDLLEHYVERAFENDRVLVALGKKIIPDLSSVQGSLDVKYESLTDLIAAVQAKRNGNSN